MNVKFDHYLVAGGLFAQIVVAPSAIEAWAITMTTLKDLDDLLLDEEVKEKILELGFNKLETTTERDVFKLVKE